MFLFFVKWRPAVIARATACRGMKARKATETAVHSDSIVLVAVVDCIFETHNTGQFASSMFHLRVNENQNCNRHV